MLPASLSRVLWAILASTSWMIVSSYLIILNRHLMCDLKFAYPMTLSGMGMITSWILSVLACRVFKWVEAKQIITLEFWVTRILPVGFFTAVTLWTGNEVYLYLSISFIQMLKAFTPVITLICLTIAGLEVPSKSMITAVLLTAAGTALAAYGEVNLSFLGLIINTTSAVAESIRLVLAQYLLTGLKFHPIEGLMHMAPACMLWLYAGALVVEMPKMVPAMAWKIVLNHPIKFCGAALLGFCVNVLAFLSIKLASSLTLKVLGTVKNTLMVMASVMFLGEVVTLVQGFGYGFAVLGFAWYTKIKTAQISEAPPSSSALTKEQQKIKDMEDPPLKPIMDHSGSLASLKQPLLTFKSGSSFSS